MAQWKVRCSHSKMVPVGHLKPHPKNPNDHPEDQIPRLAQILEYQGWRYPIKVSNLSGYITSGHGRLQAAMHANQTEVPVDFQDYESPEQEYADVVADNAIAEWAKLDLASINIQVPDLGPDFDLDLLGMKDFVLDLSEKFDGDPDAVPNAPKEAKTKRGELWMLGTHRVLCGDATSKEDVDLLMNGEKAALVVTSPPYNQKLDSFKPSGMQKESPGWVNKMASAYSDSLPEETYQQQQIDLLSVLWNFTNDDASFFYNHKIRYRDKEILTPYSWLSRSDWKIRQEIIWDRGGSITLNARMFIPCDERIFWMTKGEFNFNDSTEIKSWSSVWRIAPKNEIKGVSAPFPNELPERCVKSCSNPNDFVLEPYCGTGTTLIACEKTGRKCFGMEIEPLYIDVILSRWAKFTGKDPVCEDGRLWSVVNSTE